MSESITAGYHTDTPAGVSYGYVCVRAVQSTVDLLSAVTFMEKCEGYDVHRSIFVICDALNVRDGRSR